ncbi:MULTISPECIES: TIGR03084 family metal-binding protein [Actinomadura]|uniref:TIGR03084 family metal-binding protein n=1 Tax=Actinomadura miaoliensis TaxID=430685 RepID=A0ABP7WNE5_9ACTN
MTGLRNVFEDLAAEGDDVDRIVAGLDEAGWRTPTPAPGWTVFDQIAHLIFIYQLAGTAATDAGRFQKMVADSGDDFEAAVNARLADHRHLTPAQLLERFRAERAATVRALAAVPADQVVPWLVRPLPAAILACAGIMELFGHGQDVADAVGAEREYTDRLVHLVGFTVLVRDFGYQARGLTPPDHEFRFEITAPSGALWTFGPEDSPDRITGSAVDLCLLAGRRRHRADLDLVATGPEADRWLDIAQNYRGPAGPGRRPGQFAVPAR